MNSKAKAFQELEREIEYLSPHTQRQYRAHVGDYLDFVGNRDWRDRDVVYNYIEKLRKKAYSQSHVTYLLRGPVGCLFRAHGLRLPAKVPKFKGPRVDLSSRISFSFDEVLQLIKAVQASNNPQWKAYLALSTTFGLRASEIRQLRKQDIKGNKTIMIYTLKEGVPREHLIPPAIKSYVLNSDYPMVSETRMSLVFDEIRQAAGLTKIPRKSWHAIRHSVLTYLLLSSKGKVSESIIYKFMRWKGEKMLGVYFTPQAFEDDKEVYPIHPFLKYWEGKDGM